MLGLKEKEEPRQYPFERQKLLISWELVAQDKCEG